MMLMDGEVRSAASNTTIFGIVKGAAQGSISKRSLVTIIRPSTGQVMGSVRFKSFESSIDIMTNGRETRLKEDGIINFRYSFPPSSLQNVTWFWAESKGGELKLTDAKNSGQTLATISRSILVVEQHLGLSEAVVDEIVVSALAIAEKKRRSGKDAEVVGEVLGGVFGG